MSKVISNLKYKKVSDAAASILNSGNVYEAPVDVFKLAKLAGVSLEQADLGNDISGMLIIHKGRGTIAYSASQGNQRKRFTIAHELGHFILHNQDSADTVFLDKDFIVKYRSNKAYSEIELRQEQEANAFAASLLMPKELIFAELKKEYVKNMSETELIEELAAVFDVSVPAMTFRLTNLNLLY